MLVPFLLIIWLSDCLCLAHIVEIMMNLLSVLFRSRDRSSPSYFSRKLFEFEAYANSLDYVYCQYLIKKNLVQEANFSPINEGSC